MQPLYLRHITLASSIGIGLAATLQALRERRSGLAPCAFETAELNTFVGQVADRALAPVRADLARFDCRNNRLAQLALQQDGFAAAAAQARHRFGPTRIGVFVGTSTSGILETELAYRRREPHTGALPADFDYADRHNTYSLAAFVQAWLDLRGPSVVVSTACSSSVQGVCCRGPRDRRRPVRRRGRRRRGQPVPDHAVRLPLPGAGLLDALPALRSRSRRHLHRRGRRLRVARTGGRRMRDLRLLGVGESSDAYHMSTPHPEGLGARLAMERALRSAGLEPGAIDYINLHGTATRTNDESEARAVHALFGAATPCSSTKGWTGHALGASGIIEAAICWLAVQHGFMPGSCHTLVKTRHWT